MAQRTTLLGTDELWRTFASVDAVELVAATLVRQASGCAPAETSPACRIVLVPGRNAGDEEMVMVEDLDVGARSLSPASGLHALHTAATVVLAARTLLVPGVVTAAVIGAPPAVHPHLAVIVGQVPGVSHLALHCPGAPAARVGADVLDTCERTGTRMLVATTVAEAVYGANLVVLSGPEPTCPRLTELALGAVLVNASGRELPRRLVRGVDGIYVDQVELLAPTHRELVRPHPQGQVLDDRRRVDADLGQVLTGHHPGRRRVDDVLLVELLGTRELDVELARLVHQVAVEHGLGTPLPEDD